MAGGFAAALHEHGMGCDSKGCGSNGSSFGCRIERCCGASVANAMPGLSMGSAVGALATDVCVGLSVSCAVGTFAAAEGTGVVAAKKHVVEP